MNKYIFNVLLCMCTTCAGTMAAEIGYRSSHPSQSVITKMTSDSRYTRVSGTGAYSGIYINDAFDNKMTASFSINHSTHRTSSIPVRTSFSTAASNIQPGTLYKESISAEEITTPRQAPRTPGVPDVKTPIGDGWSVIVFLILLAIGYHVAAKRKNVEN